MRSVNTPPSEATAALLAALNGAGEVEPDAYHALAALPIALAVALGHFLARCVAPAAREAAERIREQLWPLAGQTIRLDDDLAKLALALVRADEAITLLERRLAQ